MNNNNGFTIIEVLASIVILVILLTIFFQFFIFSKSASSNNQEKLVAINIAQKVLEQIKADAYPEITENADPAITYPYTYDKESSCDSLEASETAGCINRYVTHINKTSYLTKIIVNEEMEMRLHSVEVIIEDDNGKIKSKVKGFVEI
ncbi:type IV pilus modification PilV family protein [Mesobacillus harenae]|uniref:type IV pilus modification PilV family protein n=1 Tax=Mesobacillus harenae TaxID=2213203 RepID=UPI00158028F7|nr:type II secretion system protein [Mesobacillus harenae]